MTEISYMPWGEWSRRRRVLEHAVEATVMGSEEWMAAMLALTRWDASNKTIVVPEEIEYASLDEAHQWFIDEQLGDHDRVNFGWGSTPTGITSKVYPHGLVSTEFTDNGVTVHTFEPFEAA